MLIPVEIGWDTTAVIPGLPGHYKLGYAHDTSQYPDLYLTETGQPIGLGNNLPGRPVRGQNGVWVMADQMIVSHGGRWRGLYVMGSYARSSQATSFNSDTALVSLIDRGSIPGRPDDVIQLALSWYGISPRAQALRRALQLVGSGYDPGDLQRNEYVIEANYATSFIRGTTLQPALQYFVHPNAQSNIKNAFVFALRVTARL